MFEKIVNDALMSPSMIGELSRYKQQLDKSIQKKIWIVIFSALFIVLQYFALFSLTTPQNGGANASDTIYGGIESTNELLTTYDQHSSDFYKAAESLGITRDEIQKITEDTSHNSLIHHKNVPLIAWSKIPTYQAPVDTDTKRAPVQFFTSYKDFRYYGYSIVQHKTLTRQKVFSGHSDKTGDFIILKNNGNFVTSTGSADTCYKSPDKEGMFYTNCLNGEHVITNIEVKNVGYKTDGSLIKNRSGDQLDYTLTLENRGTSPITTTPELYIGDILEYTTLSDYRGGLLDQNTNTLRWPKTTLNGGQSSTYVFSVKVADKIPLSPQGTTNRYSYNCQLDSFFGKFSHVSISCPTPKVIERLLQQPITSSFLVIGWLGLFLNSVLLYRTHLYRKQVRLLLKNLRSKHV